MVLLAAHELKTPLTTLKGYCQMLVRRGAHSEDEQRLFRVINAQSDRMAHLVQMLVDVSQTRSGDLVLNHSQVDVCALANRVVHSVRPTAPKHQLALHCDGRAVLVVDQERVREVLLNLWTARSSTARTAGQSISRSRPASARWWFRCRIAASGSPQPSTRVFFSRSSRWRPW
jgi:K+-sensing histidine kinase KdpD